MPDKMENKICEFTCRMHPEPDGAPRGFHIKRATVITLPNGEKIWGNEGLAEPISAKTPEGKALLQAIVGELLGDHAEALHDMRQKHERKVEEVKAHALKVAEHQGRATEAEALLIAERKAHAQTTRQLHQVAAAAQRVMAQAKAQIAKEPAAEAASGA